MKIAVIEDSDTDVFIYQETFLNGFDFDRYGFAGDFLEQNDLYDVVFLDLNLPDMMGLELIKAVRSNHDKKLIVVTGTGSGYLRGKNMRDIMCAGADEVFQKSFIKQPAYIEMIKGEFICTDLAEQA